MDRMGSLTLSWHNCQFGRRYAVGTVDGVVILSARRSSWFLKFDPQKELAHLRVKIARAVHERVERYREFCGALELADLVERALVYVMDKDSDFRAHEKEGASIPTKGVRQPRAKRFSPADKPGGAP